MAYYRFCSKEECEERQSLKQVSELEATVETCRLPQAKRILDPSLAVPKYRRSAAGTTTKVTATTRQQLQATLQHLLSIAAIRQASPQHPRVTSWTIWAEFLVDRLRACQADATRLLGTTTPLPPSWHATLARTLIWIRYWTLELPSGGDVWMPRMIHTLLSTALEQYWVAREITTNAAENNDDEDDEILCWSSLLRISQSSQQQQHDVGGLFQSLLLDYSKHVIVSSSKEEEEPAASRYPLFHLALKLASHMVREEYYVVWKHYFTETLPVLAKCCLAPSLPLWRYRIVQRYNVGFSKKEAVADMPRLLGFKGEQQLPNDYSFGLPVETRENDVVVLILKSIVMNDDDPDHTSPRREDAWVFGGGSDETQKEEPMGLSSEQIRELLKNKGNE